jgi:uncharacterized membrane protein YcaP (DUF421 family)
LTFVIKAVIVITMEFIKKMLSGESEVSCMRVMSMISLLMGGLIAGIGLFKGVDLSELSILAGVFVTSAFAGKAAQAFSEKKGG